MIDFLNRILYSFIFWSAWIIIPIIVEIIPSFGNLWRLYRRRKSIKDKKEIKYFPDIVVIVPVYNQEKSLYRCLSSIESSSYPNDKMMVYVINNGSTDGSFREFCKAQSDFSSLRMIWQNAESGKARAINMGLFHSSGKYIINIDSDGVLAHDALQNMVTRFEERSDLNVMTGVILTDHKQIKKNPKVSARILQNLEYMEYAQAFLAGRSYASQNSSIYTLSGAFSAFRSSAILTSWLYNPDTICEDTHLTFQMRYRQKQRIECCEDAVFYTDPIESWGKLYTQRQRWQIGSIEVARMFFDEKKFRLRNLKDVNVRTMVLDHTFAFPRIIWYLVLLIFMAMQYSPRAVFLSMLVIFALYILVGYAYFFSSEKLLRSDPDNHHYYVRHAGYVALLPFYNLIVFIIRIIGIVNGISVTRSWTTMTPGQEWDAFVSTAKEMLRKPHQALERARAWINSEDV